MQLSSSKCSLLFVAAVLGGCNHSDQPRTYPVSGKALYRDGTPLKNATVRFRTTDRVPAFTASGKTDDQGAFHFSAADGENAAIVVPWTPRDTDAMTPTQRDRAMNPIDSMFLDYEASKLKFQVTTDPSKNQFEIKVWPPRG
jgi:hypothetical protein